jgi:hypothetical protein
VFDIDIEQCSQLKVPGSIFLCKLPFQMTKKSPSKIAEDSPIRQQEIAKGELVLRQRAKGGELLTVKAPVDAAIRR